VPQSASCQPAVYLALSGHNDDSGSSEFWAVRLEIRLASTNRINPTAVHTATRTIARIEFQVIGTRGSWANDYGHAAITVDVG